MENSHDIPINALVVDDNEVNILVLTNLLMICGIHADRAERGSIAVSLSQKTAYDFVFIDHLMPEMDGIRTTQLIRSQSCNPETIIIALTSKVTQQLGKKFKQAGADELYEKPLELSDISAILERWYPKLHQDQGFPKHNANIYYGNNELIQAVIETIDDIDYPTGLKYAAQDAELYIHILEAALSDLQSCRNIIIKSRTNNSKEELKLGIHKLYNVYSNIGAVKLSTEAALYEKASLYYDMTDLNIRYSYCMNKLDSFLERLKAALDSYHTQTDSQGGDRSINDVPMSKAEYEQCLQKTIYYIRRYEYASIISEVEQLSRRGFAEDRPMLMTVLRDIRNYDYKKALKRLNVLKNKTGDLPVREN